MRDLFRTYNAHSGRKCRSQKSNNASATRKSARRRRRINEVYISIFVSITQGISTAVTFAAQQHPESCLRRRRVLSGFERVKLSRSASSRRAKPTNVDRPRVSLALESGGPRLTTCSSAHLCIHACLVACTITQALQACVAHYLGER
jgi:hypothetical protein